jgi:hypothetical protein
VALAHDMADAPMTKDTITAGSDGDDDNDQGDNDQEAAPVTQDTINVEEDSRDNNDKDNSGQNNNDNNDDKPATETYLTVLPVKNVLCLMLPVNRLLR